MMTTIAIIAALTLGATSVPVAAAPDDRPTTIVLAHGAFVDGSGWMAVHNILREDADKAR